jgi:hypothetical protein
MSRQEKGVFPRAALLAALALAGTGCHPKAVGADAPIDRSSGALPEVHVPHLAPGAVVVDGKLDESAWARAGQTGGFVGPMDGRPSARSQVNGSARMVWDDANLYIGFTILDPNPVTPFSPSDVDPHLWEKASAVELMIQPGDFGDNADYYEIQVDTVGSIWDTHFDNYNQPIQRFPDGTTRFGHQEWESHAQKAAVVDRSGGRYFLEVAIPWSAFLASRTSSPPHPGDTWRMNFYSFRAGQSDALAWSPTLGRGNFHIASRFGKVIFDP